MRQLFLDTETTGLNIDEGHRVVEIAMVEYVDREPTGRDYHTYINPQRPVDPGAYRVHGLSDDFLSGYPAFDQLAEQIVDFMRDAKLVAHNLDFDLAFLKAEFARCNVHREVPLPAIHDLCQLEDSLALARSKYGGRNDLNTLCARLNIDNVDRALHGALVDARLLGKVYIAMTSTQESLQLVVDTVRHDQISDQLPDDLRFLRVVSASEEELAAHQQYMQGLKNS